MAIDLASIQKGEAHKPPRILIHGVEKIGKTTIAANAPAPIFIQTEDGADEIGIDRFPLAKSYEEVMEAMSSLLGEHSYQTLVIDSLDWLEPLVWNHTCEANKWESIETPGYGKGYVEAMTYWQYFFDLLDQLREKGMTIIMISHSEITRFDDPNSDSYSRYELKLQKRVAGKLKEFCDLIGFANQRMVTMKEDVGFNQKRNRGVGTGERILFTEARPSYVAGNRYSMPAELPLNWDSVAKNIPYFNNNQVQEKKNGTTE